MIFIKKQNTKTRAKIDYVLKLIRELDKIPQPYFKRLVKTNGLYEIQIKLGTNVKSTLIFIGLSVFLTMETDVSS